MQWCWRGGEVGPQRVNRSLPVWSVAHPRNVIFIDDSIRRVDAVLAASPIDSNI
jgi:hypothetical protein